MKRFLLMAGVLVALLAGCEKSGSKVEIVPSTPEELLDYCQGKWIRIQRQAFNGELTKEEPGYRHVLVFKDDMMYETKTDEQESGILPFNNSHKMVSNDGKEMVFNGLATAVGSATGVVSYEKNEQLLLGIYSFNHAGDGPYGGLYSKSFYVRTDLPVLTE